MKNRIHLDLQFGEESRDEQVQRALALGATRLWDGQQGPHRRSRWRTQKATSSA